MKKWICLTAAGLMTAASAAELKVCIDGESKKASGNVTYIAGGIRQVPGRFGKGLLIERRTVNSFAPADVIVCDGGKLSGKTNRLTLPADGFAALPLTAIRPKSNNTLSFLYKGEGKITVTFGGKTLGVFTAGKEFKKAEVIVTPEEDNGTLRIRSEKSVELDNVMFDKSIGWANTYHAPGKMRTVDAIELKPELFDTQSGAISCWIKAPWLNKKSKYATAIALCDAKDKVKGKAVFYFCTWSNNITMITRSKAPKGVISGLRMDELPEPADGGWYHFVYNWKVEKDVMTVAIIVNGEKVFKKQGLWKASIPTKTFTVGYVNGAYLNGVLDDFGLFSAPLSLEEAKKIFTSTQPLSTLYKK